MISFLPRPPNRLVQVRLGNLFTTGKVTSGNLCVDFDPRVGWNEVLWEIVALDDRNTRVDDGVVFPNQRYFSKCK